MSINKENYPAYFLDYYEGRLSAADVSALFVFLDAHPELQHDFDAFRPVMLEPDSSIQFPGRASLKRGQITKENYDWYFAAWAEGDLDVSGRKAVEAFAAGDPALARELQLYARARLDSSDMLTFPDRDALKKVHVVPVPLVKEPAEKSAAWIPLWKYLSAAAVVLLLAGLFFLRTPESPDTILFTDHSRSDEIQELPVADGADIPVAVAEVPSRQQVPASPMGGIRGLTEPDQGQISGGRSVRVSRPAGNQAGEAEKPTQEKRIQPPPARRLPAIPVAALERHGQHTAHASLDPRTTLAFWSPEALPGPENDAGSTAAGNITVSQPRQGLAQVLRSGTVDFSKVEERIAENRFPLRELAGLGLSALGSFAGERLGLEAEKDENGRIIQLSLGERFEARRE